MNNFNIRQFITNDFLLHIISQKTLSTETVLCPDCQCIDDEQYTCTSCWCCGGDVKLDVHSLVQEAYKIKFKNEHESLWTLDFISRTLKEVDSFICLFDFDFKTYFPDYVFQEESYIEIDFNDIYYFLFESK